MKCDTLLQDVMACRGTNLQAIKVLFLLITQKMISFGLKRDVETRNNVQVTLTGKFIGRESIKPC